MSWKITFCQQIGNRHKQNQDALFNGKEVIQTALKKAERIVLDDEKYYFGIADGISNSPKSQNASRFVMESLANCNKLTISWLKQVQFELSEKLAEQYLGSSTTFVGCELIESGKFKILNVGDSRAYKITAKSEWIQLSFDHIVLNEIAPNIKENSGSEYANIYRCLSDCLVADYEYDNFNVFSQEHSLEEGESLLLCSDGFSDYLSQALRDKIWQKYPTNQQRLTICRKMVKKHRLYDDFSVVVCERI